MLRHLVPHAVVSLVGLSWAAPAWADDGRLGLRFAPIDEGLLVTAVSPDLGAAKAGIVPGTLIVEVDGISVSGAPDNAREHLIGPSGTSVELVVQAPLSSKQATVAIQRTRPGRMKGRRAGQRPPSVHDYRVAVRDKRRKVAVAAATAMVADDFGGMEPHDAVGASLASAMRRSPRFARSVAQALVPGAQDDPALLQGLARVLLATGRPDEAHALLQRRARLVPPDGLWRDQPVDLGGGFQGRALAIDAAWQVGERTAAIDQARSLLATHRDPAVAGIVGLATDPADTRWKAELPALESFSVDTLAGEPFSLSDHAGEVVLLNFWATWCGPCKKELPELVELQDALADSGLTVLAVSVDDGPTEPVAAMADKLGLTMPVAHAPELGERFGASAIPALRLVGRDGALHYSARGYSPAAVEKLHFAVDQALAAPAEGGAPVATVWGAAASEARLLRFIPLAGTRGIYGDAERLVVGVQGGSPAVFSVGGDLLAESDVTTTREVPGDRVAWLDGPVAADVDHFVVRAWDDEGTPRWMQILPAPAVDLVVSDNAVWVATHDGLVVLSSDGSVLAQTDKVQPSDLAVRPGGGVWLLAQDGLRKGVVEWSQPENPEGVDDGQTPERPRVQPTAELVVSAVTQAPSHHTVVAAGEQSRASAGSTARHLLVGRFGPDGAERVVAVRGDDRLLAYDGDGQPVLVVELRRGGQPLAVDLDGDGHDSLWVALPDHGVAQVELTLP